MWIRSQSRQHLVDVTNIWYADLQDCCKIFGNSGAYTQIAPLGTYANAEEANLVLSKIQSLLAVGQEKTYQMPDRGIAANFVPRCGNRLERCSYVVDTAACPGTMDCRWIEECKTIWRGLRR